jgi:hypothetical protein
VGTKYDVAMSEQAKSEGAGGRNRKVLTMGEYMVDTLSNNRRDEAEKLVKAILYSLRNTENYLRDYLAGRVNAAKVAVVITQASERTQDDIARILRMHQNKA